MSQWWEGCTPNDARACGNVPATIMAWIWDQESLSFSASSKAAGRMPVRTLPPFVPALTACECCVVQGPVLHPPAYPSNRSHVPVQAHLDERPHIEGIHSSHGGGVDGAASVGGMARPVRAHVCAA